MTTSSETEPRLGARFLKDQHGVAAVEFLLVAPLLLALMFGTVQFTSAFAAARKLTQVAHTMSDLIAQATTAGDCDIKNALKVGTAIMSPYSAASLTATISEVYIDPTTHQATIVWSKASPGKTPHSQGNVVAVPSGIALDGKYLIMSEVHYDYQPLIGFDGKSNFNSEIFHWDRKTFSGPRQSADVRWDPSAPSCS
ncbi:Flp pilus assembly protein TadG [Nitrobacteraceae bacterium AZCC 1564]